MEITCNKCLREYNPEEEQTHQEQDTDYCDDCYNDLPCYDEEADHRLCDNELL